VNATSTASGADRRIVVAVVLLALVSAFGYPLLDRALNPGATTPSVISLGGVGLSVLVLTLALLRAGLRGVLPRSGVFLGAMFGYSALLVLVKFALGPLALYVESEHNGFFVLATDNPSNFLYVIAFPALAAITALLYGLTFFLLYLYYRSRLRRRLGINVRVEQGFTALLITMFSIGAVATVTGIGLYGFLEYLVSFLAVPVLAALLAVALVGALVLCAVAFHEANEQAVLMRNVTVLSTFAWIGLAFIAAYHILWLVFILTLIALFPLKAMNVK
jgi:hypothetical protein